MMITAGLGMVDRDIEVGKEYKVGTFTVDGVTYDRYVKIIKTGSLPSSISDGKTIPHGIVGVQDFISVYGVAKRNVGTNKYTTPIPYVMPTSSTSQFIGFYIETDSIKIYANYDFHLYDGYVILEYYK